MFNVISRSDKFVLPKEDMSKYSDMISISSSPESSVFGQIFVLESALNDLNNHISWNQYTEKNLKEMGGFMLGYVYQDIKTGIPFAVVKRMVPVQNAVGTATFLHMTVDAIYEAKQTETKHLEDGLMRVGWYHTHPGPLNVFMSNIDMEMQRKWYSEPWQFAVVFNPQRMIWAGFRGKEACKVNCSLLCNRDSVNKNVFFNNEKYRSVVQEQLNSEISERMEEMEEISNIRLIDYDVLVDELYSKISVFGKPKLIKSIYIDGYITLKKNNSEVENLYYKKIYFNFNKNVHVKTELNDNNKGDYRIVIYYKNNIDKKRAYKLLDSNRREKCITCIFNKTRRGRFYYLRDTNGNIIEGKLFNNNKKP